MQGKASCLLSQRCGFYFYFFYKCGAVIPSANHYSIRLCCFSFEVLLVPIGHLQSSYSKRHQVFCLLSSTHAHIILMGLICHSKSEEKPGSLARKFESECPDFLQLPQRHPEGVVNWRYHFSGDCGKTEAYERRKCQVQRRMQKFFITRFEVLKDWGGGGETERDKKSRQYITVLVKFLFLWACSLLEIHVKIPLCSSHKI